MSKLLRLGICLLTGLTLYASPVLSQQIRQLRPIATAYTSVALPNGAEPLETIIALDSRDIGIAVEQIVDNWNSNNLDEALSEQFFDRERLLQAMDTQVPRDANMRVLNINNVQTLQQYLEPQDNGAPDLIVSIVSATVATQIEYNTANGFVRLPGTNEMIMKISVEE